MQKGERLSSSDILFSADFQEKAAQICEVGHEFAVRNWCPATSSNFSQRLNAESNLVAITISGRDKGRLSSQDIMVVDSRGDAVAPHGQKPSAETLIHTAIYEDESVQAVLHTHSPKSTVLSLEFLEKGQLCFEGYEILKAFSAHRTHDTKEIVPIFPNSQDMVAFQRSLTETAGWKQSHGFLIAGHGLYTWGNSIEDARRHVEAYEFLFECFIERLKIV